MATTFPVRAETGPAVRDIDQLIAALRKTGKEAGMTEKEIDDLIAKSSKFGKDGAKGVNEINAGMTGLNKTIMSVGKSLGALFAADTLINIGKNVISVRAEFEKLQAVLTNSLGSGSRAQEALRMIQELAAKTPFSVIQLTQSYVKLVNQGFKPTAQEIIRLGDLASSTGKEFDQLTEALIDAQTGEFERLKEFGIRASKEGDRVSFTFKGVKTQVDFTSESIQKYILSLGDLEGVSGSMAAISETLGGKISNLGDSFDRLANVTGEALSPSLGVILEDLTNMISLLSEDNLSKFEKLNLLLASPADRALALEVLKLQRQNIDAEKERAINATVNAALASGNVEAYIKALEQNIYKEEIIARIREKQAKDQKAADDEEAKRTEAKLKRLEELKKTTFEISGIDEKAIEFYKEQNRLIEERKKTIEQLLAVVGMSTTQTGDILAGFTPDSETADNVEFKSLEDLRNIEQQKQALRQETYEQAVNLLQSYAAMQQQTINNELQWMRYRYNEEVRLAGDNTAAKEKISAQYARKEAELMNRQANQQQQLALFNVLLSQGPALAKTIAQNGFPAALPLMLLVAAQFALLSRNTRAIQPPRFKDGVYGLDGPGNETSDSIPAWLSRNESVVPANKSKYFRDLLKPLIESEQFSWNDIKRIVDGKLPGVAPAIMVGGAGTDSAELVNEMRATRKAIESKRETRLHLDEHGFGLYLGQQGNWTKVVNKRYSMP